MTEYTFTQKNPLEEVSISFKNPSQEGATLQTFYRYCETAALTFGYTTENINKIFSNKYCY